MYRFFYDDAGQSICTTCDTVEEIRRMFVHRVYLSDGRMRGEYGSIVVPISDDPPLGEDDESL